MKKIQGLLFFTLVTSFTSCEKQDIKPESSGFVIESNDKLNPIGHDWVLHSGRVFVKNLESNEMFYYDHFGPNKNGSNLNIYGGSWLPFDTLIVGITSWKFTDYDKFILNNNLIYDQNINTNNIFNVYGLENGSQRSVEVLNSTENYINVKVYESFGGDGTHNYSFYTVLTFIKLGFTGTPITTGIPFGYTYKGVI